MGLFHPHADKHHIKKENIGLIEVMGLAVLPSRLKGELTALAEAIVEGSDIAADETLAKYAAWVEELKGQYTFTAENALDIILQDRRYDLGYIYNWGNLYTNIRTIIIQGKDTFASTWEKGQKAFNTAMEKTLVKYEELNEQRQ